MKVASYIFYGLAVRALIACISAASFAKEELGRVFGSGTLFLYGGAAVLAALIGLACGRLAQRRRY